MSSDELNTVCSILIGRWVGLSGGGGRSDGQDGGSWRAAVRSADATQATGVQGRRFGPPGAEGVTLRGFVASIHGGASGLLAAQESGPRLLARFAQVFVLLGPTFDDARLIAIGAVADPLFAHFAK